MSESIKPLTMPKWGLSMKEGKVANWLLKEGDPISPGTEVLEVETEKISSAVEAAESGVLRRIVAQEGETLPVGALLGVIADAGEGSEAIDAFVAEFQKNYVPPADDDEESGPRTQTVEVNGRAIRYLKQGDGGTPLVLIHGFGGDLNNWLFNQEALAAGRAVISFDLPGHGQSSKQVGNATLGEFTQVLHDLLDKLDVPKAHLAGHSMGGAIALEFALAHPGRVASLTLIAPAGLGPEINGGYIDGFIESSGRRDLKPHLEQLFADADLVSRQMINDILAYKRLDGVDAALRAIRDKFSPGGRQATVVKDRVGTIAAPIQVIWGEKDAILPPRHAEGLPGSVKVTKLPNAGHMPQMEAASEVNKLIEAHIG
ncbi:MAG: acetoin dehydrogenase dihydrolipoyllysine-residue acetyltransferase subunit [Alphaproteobacteria bacterium]